MKEINYPRSDALISYYYPFFPFFFSFFFFFFSLFFLTHYLIFPSSYHYFSSHLILYSALPKSSLFNFCSPAYIFLFFHHPSVPSPLLAFSFSPHLSFTINSHHIPHFHLHFFYPLSVLLASTSFLSQQFSLELFLTSPFLNYSSSFHFSYTSSFPSLRTPNCFPLISD